MERQTINYAQVTEDDAITDAMKGAVDIDKKKLLMRYKRLKQEVLKRDPVFTSKVMRNFFTCIKKVGPLLKRSEGLMGGWHQYFCVISNAGLIYFKNNKMDAKSDLEPRNFKPLNDFIIQEVPESVSTNLHKYSFSFQRAKYTL